MKKLLPILGLISCLLLSGCSTTLMGSKNQDIPYETFGTKPQPEDPTKMMQYKKAMDAPSHLRYQEALRLFTELGDFKDAAEYAARFTYLEDTLVRTEQYTDGVLTKSEEAKYNQAGELQGTGVLNGFRVSYTTTESGLLESGVWQYDDYILTRQYNVYNHVGTVSREEKRPTFHSIGKDGIKEGYNISYVYNADGVLIADQGEVQQHTLSGNDIRVSKLLFNGVYSYDAQGRLLRYDREYTWGGMGTGWTVYTYDQDNRLIREESGKKGNIFFIDAIKSEDAYRQEDSVKEYRYDQEGNMIFMSQSTTSGPLDAQPETYYYIQQEYEYADGRLVKETTTFGDTSDTVIETCYVYGDYLGYIIDEEVTGNDS